MSPIEMVTIMFVTVFAMVTIVSVRVSDNRRKVAVAQHSADRIVLHADAVTGEVRTEEAMPANVGTNQTGVWAKP